MSSIFQIVLTGHVIFGIIGVMALFAVWVHVLKKEPKILFLSWSSFIAFVSFVLSWVSGGYYYVFYYGSAVKPIIKAGDYPWAHLVFMEAKEHLFLFLPISGFVLFLIFALLGNRIKEDMSFKSAISTFAGVLALIGIFITVAGIVVSGGAQ